MEGEVDDSGSTAPGRCRAPRVAGERGGGVEVGDGGDCRRLRLVVGGHGTTSCRRLWTGPPVEVMRSLEGRPHLIGGGSAGSPRRRPMPAEEGDTSKPACTKRRRFVHNRTLPGSFTSRSTRPMVRADGHPEAQTPGARPLAEHEAALVEHRGCSSMTVSPISMKRSVPSRCAPPTARRTRTSRRPGWPPVESSR